MIFKKSIKTKCREDLINISNFVTQAIQEPKIEEGLAHIFIPHTTAGLTCNENADPDVKKDILKGLNSLDLEKLSFLHREGNSPAHIKSSLMGQSILIPFSASKLLIGVWQGIYFCEFDGPRDRFYYIKVMNV